jgi:DNA-binding NarL/FixJ family response regulator
MDSKVPKKKVILVDDHKLFRNGLKFILSDLPELDIVGEASNGKEFLEILKYIMPDLVLMDISMPEMNGVEASTKALEKYPDLNIMILTMFSDEQYYNTFIEIGVKGFVLKECDNSELITAVKTILNGGTYFSQELLLKLIRNKNHSEEVIQLTKREKEVLTLICKGCSNNQISDELHISQRTVERHRANLLMKTESNNSISLVIFAIKNGLVTI